MKFNDSSSSSDSESEKTEEFTTKIKKSEPKKKKIKVKGVNNLNTTRDVNTNNSMNISEKLKNAQIFDFKINEEGAAKPDEDLENISAGEIGMTLLITQVLLKRII